MSTRVALLTIDAIIAPLTVFDKRATDTVFARVYMSTVSNSLGIISAVTQVAISTLIPIIGVFTVFTFVLKDMRDRTLKKELSRLIKKRSIKIRLRGKRICWGEPFLSIPNRIGTISRERWNNLFSRLITTSSMERPIWIKRPKILEAIFGLYRWEIVKSKLLS